MTARQIEIIKQSWQSAQHLDPVLIGDFFYSKLFLEYPEVQPLFKISRVEQANKLISTLALVVAKLETLGELSNAIKQMAIRHVNYGVKAEHYQLVGECLLWTLQTILKDKWNKELEEAWATCYGTLAQTMIDAAYVPAEQAA